MSDSANGSERPAPRPDDRELEAPDYLGRPMPGSGATQNMGMRLGMPGCLVTLLGVVTVVLGVGRGNATAVVGGVILVAFGVAAWSAAIRADMRRHRDG